MFSFSLLVIFLLSTLFSFFFGTSTETGSALFAGAEKAVSFCLSAGGGICLWSAVMEVMERCGLASALSNALRPLLGRLFPHAAGDGQTMAALSQNVSANLLGLGNAATPLGLEAARRMSRRTPGVAGDSLCMLVVCNTASIQLIPTTVAAVRMAAGCRTPFDILPAVWVTSLLSVLTGIAAAKLCARLWRS